MFSGSIEREHLAGNGLIQKCKNHKNAKGPPSHSHLLISALIKIVLMSLPFLNPFMTEAVII